jgi:hypothetical protein
MDFVSHRKGGMVFYQVSFLLYKKCKRLREFEGIKFSSKAVEVTANNKEENFCLGFVQQFDLRTQLKLSSTG